jgi:hypothetical protein
MTRTAIRYMLSALAAVALVFAFAGRVSAEPQSYPILKDVPSIMKASPKSKPRSARQPKGLATQQRPPVACDCTNCSAAHCQPPPPGSIIETGAEQ